MTPCLYIAHQVALFTRVYKKEQAVFTSFTFKSAESTVIKMEKHIIVSKQEFCGRSQKSMRMLENVVKHNALNKRGLLNYNKGGVKDGVGFQPCSDKFVENFILRVLVADYFIHKKSYAKVGSINRTIHAMLERMGSKSVKSKQSLYPMQMTFQQKF